MLRLGKLAMWFNSLILYLILSQNVPKCDKIVPVFGLVSEEFIKSQNLILSDDNRIASIY